MDSVVETLTASPLITGRNVGGYLNSNTNHSKNVDINNSLAGECGSAGRVTA